MTPNVIVLDCETTGLDKERDYVIDTCIHNTLSGKTSLWRTRPPVPIPEEISKIHGITDEMVKDAPIFGGVADYIAKEISEADVIVGYNPDFDIDMLKSEFKRSGVEPKWPSVVICCKRLWDHYDPRPPRHLQNAFKEFVDQKGFEGAHGAAADVAATVKVFNLMVERFNLSKKPYEEYDPNRARMFGSSDHFHFSEDGQALLVGFGKHKGKTVMDLDAWYLNFLREKDFPKHVKDLAERAAEQKKSNQSLEQNNATIASWAKVYGK